MIWIGSEQWHVQFEILYSRLFLVVATERLINIDWLVELNYRLCPVDLVCYDKGKS